MGLRTLFGELDVGYERRSLRHLRTLDSVPNWVWSMLQRLISLDKSAPLVPLNFDGKLEDVAESTRAQPRPHFFASPSLS